jgi:hypothetical protein
LFMEHDLFRKPVPTFRDHALTDGSELLFTHDDRSARQFASVGSGYDSM